MKTKNKIWIVIGIILLLLIFNQPESDKKESTSEIGRTVMGAGIIAAGVAVIVLTGGTGVGVGIPLVIGGGSYAFGTGLIGLFTPDISIPPWVWVIAGIGLLMMVLKNKI